MSVLVDDLRLTLSADIASLAAGGTAAMEVLDAIQAVAAGLRFEMQQGNISREEYAQGMRALSGDLQTVANTAKLEGDEIKRLAALTSQITGQTANFGRVARSEFRQSHQIDMLVMSMGNLASGGVGVMQGLTGAARAASLLTMSMPQLYAVVSVLGLIVTGIAAITNARKEDTAAADAQEKAEAATFARHTAVATQLNRTSEETIALQRRRSDENARDAVHLRRLAELQGAVTGRITEFGEVLEMVHPGTKEMADDLERQANAADHLARALGAAADAAESNERDNAAAAAARRNAEDAQSYIDALSMEADALTLTAANADAYADALHHLNAEQRELAAQLRLIARMHEVMQFPAVPRANPAADFQERQDAARNTPATRVQGQLDRAGAEQMRRNMEELATAAADMATQVGDAFETMADRIGGALANGDNLFKALLGSLASVAAGIAQRLGRMLVDAGIAAIGFGKLGVALKTFITNPFAAIAVGIGLIALGAALGAAAQNIAGGGSGASAGSAATVSGGASGGDRREGNLTIIFPRGALIDPGSVEFQDMLAEAWRRGHGRNLNFEYA